MADYKDSGVLVSAGRVAQRVPVLARRDADRVAEIRDKPREERVPEKFLDAIRVESMRARILPSALGANEDFHFKHAPKQNLLNDGSRRSGGFLAASEDARSFRLLISDFNQFGPPRVIRDVRNAAASILGRTFLSDIRCSAATCPPTIPACICHSLRKKGALQSQPAPLPARPDSRP